MSESSQTTVPDRKTYWSGWVFDPSVTIEVIDGVRVAKMNWPEYEPDIAIVTRQALQEWVDNANRMYRVQAALEGLA